MFLNNNIMTNQEIKDFISEVTEMRQIFDNQIMTYEQLFMILQMFETKRITIISDLRELLSIKDRLLYEATEKISDLEEKINEYE